MPFCIFGCDTIIEIHRMQVHVCVHCKYNNNEEHNGFSGIWCVTLKNIYQEYHEGTVVHPNCLKIVCIENIKPKRLF